MNILKTDADVALRFFQVRTFAATASAADRGFFVALGCRVCSPLHKPFNRHLHLSRLNLQGRNSDCAVEPKYGRTSDA